MTIKSALYLYCQVDRAGSHAGLLDFFPHTVGCRNWQTCPPVSGVVIKDKRSIMPSSWRLGLTTRVVL